MTVLVEAATMVPLEELKPYPGNPRRGDVTLIADSLRRHGQYRPIVANRRNSEILAGNHTLAAARTLGWPEIAVTWVDVDDDTAARIVLIDNRANDLAVYDDKALAELLGALPELDGTGYDARALAELLAATEDRPALTDPDDVPPLEAGELIAKLGDVFELGEHRVMCGDATSSEDVDALVAGDRVDVLWTDPPYGVSYVGGTKDHLTIVNDDLDAEALEQLLKGAFEQAARVLRPGGVFYVCSPSGELETKFRLALATAGLRLRQQLVWVKDRFVLGRQDYQGRHETILQGWIDGEGPLEPPLYDDAHGTLLYGWADGAGHTWEGGRRQDTVWEVPRPSASKLHPTMKPVDLVRRGIENATRPGDTVLDLFGGSGSALLASYGAGRRSLSMELDPRYVDVICRRWQQHTGRTPTRGGDPVEF